MSTEVPNSQVHVSFVCRAKVTDALLALVAEKGAGKHSVSHDILPPRQIRVSQLDFPIPCQLVWHRDAYVPALLRGVAESLVDKGLATYEPQSVLVYTRAAYLEDVDVQANPDEYNRVSDSDTKLVIVAVVGESRSPLAVCRNIVSGCTVLENVKAEAMAALSVANVFLIEDVATSSTGSLSS